MSHQSELTILRDLAKQLADLSALPVQEEKRRLWRKLNGLAPERPMVMADQVCWNEMNADGELDLLSTTPGYRHWETYLRRTLYQARHFPVDMVAEPFIRVPMAVEGCGFGMDTVEENLATDATSDVLSRHYENQFKTMEDLAKIKMPVVSHNKAETERRMTEADEIFHGILPLRAEGYDPYLSVWDPISMWMGVEAALYGMVDEPELMRALARRITDGYLIMLDQLEAQGLLCGQQSLIHCTGAWTDRLPPDDYDPKQPRTKDIWMFGLAQMFSTVSPAMFEEFEIEESMPLFERFGLVYYGCCDPLDGKMHEVRRIPHLKKVSMSPWANKERGAEQIGRDYVFSNKPNPAYLATPSFDEELVRRDLRETVDACRRFGCPLEIILKDISTVRYEPQRLWRWAEIAMEEANGD